MILLKLFVRKLKPEAKLPLFAHSGDAGLDIYSSGKKTILAGEISVIETGIAVAIPKNHVGLIKDKSGLAFKGMHCLGGVIDSGYRGEIKAIVINHSQKQVQINSGEKIAQMIIVPFESVEVKEAKELDATSRGEKGFGSTGTK